MIDQSFGGENQSGRPARNLWLSMARGFLGKCPNCGKGRLFASFVKTVEHASIAASTSTTTAPTTSPPISSW